MIELIPAIDIIDGKCVRLSQGEYSSKKIYKEDPLEMAKELEDYAHTSLVIDFGGGVKSDEDLDIAFKSGAQMVTGGSIAVLQPETFCGWIQTYGADRIILGADVKGTRIAVNGWKDDSNCEIFSFLENYQEKGVAKVICTDISCDGMLEGPSLPLYKEIKERIPQLYLIASGGVGNIEDIRRLEKAGVPAVIFGKALYEGHITLNDLREFL